MANHEELDFVFKNFEYIFNKEIINFNQKVEIEQDLGLIRPKNRKHHLIGIIIQIQQLSQDLLNKEIKLRKSI